MARFVVGDPVVLTNTFSVDGTNTDPDTVALDVTDPSGVTTNPSTTNTAVGAYEATVTTDEAGTWLYKWTGTGAAADVEDGTFEVFAVVDGTLYASLELVKSQQGISNTADDLELQVAVDTAKQAVEDFTGRFFYSATQTRTYSPKQTDRLKVDDLVTVTTLKTDAAGDGTYETTWTEDTDFVLAPENADTDSRPFTKVLRHPSGSFLFPTAYPKSVEIVGSFGWPTVPRPVQLATAMLAAVYFKVSTQGITGEAAFDLDGMGVRIPGHTELKRAFGMLRPYRKTMVA